MTNKWCLWSLDEEEIRVTASKEMNLPDPVINGLDLDKIVETLKKDFKVDVGNWWHDWLKEAIMEQVYED